MTPQSDLQLALPLRRRFHHVIASSLAHALRRTPFSHLRPFGIRESESAMRLAPLGRLRCLCKPLAQRDGLSERREVCRNCGQVIAPPQRGSFERHLSKSEIRAVVKQLRTAGIKSSEFELPAEITSLRALNTYLAARLSKPPVDSLPAITPSPSAESN